MPASKCHHKTPCYIWYSEEDGTEQDASPVFAATIHCDMYRTTFDDNEKSSFENKNRILEMIKTL